METVAVF